MWAMTITTLFPLVLRAMLPAAASVLLGDVLPSPDDMAPFLKGLWDCLLCKLGGLVGRVLWGALVSAWSNWRARRRRGRPRGRHRAE